jgi:hypothetical protein
MDEKGEARKQGLHEEVGGSAGGFDPGELGIGELLDVTVTGVLCMGRNISGVTR